MTKWEKEVLIWSEDVKQIQYFALKDVRSIVYFFYTVLLLSGYIGESPKGLVKGRRIGEPYRKVKLTLFS